MITATFPYGSVTESGFLMPAIPHMSREFERVIIVPMSAPGADTGWLKQFDNVIVESAHLGWRSERFTRFMKIFTPEVMHAVADAWRNRLPLFGAATYAAAALQWKGIMKGIVQKYALDLYTTVFYPFWFDVPATALAMLEPDFLSEGLPMHMVVRVHGYDLRERRSPWLKGLVAERAHAIYPVSKAGAEELKRLYPFASDRISLQHLGCQKLEGKDMNPIPEEAPGVFRLLSVGRVVELKRIPKILELAKAVAEAMPGRAVEWVHIGDGEDMASLRKLCADGLPANLTVDLNGSLPNEQIHLFYAAVPVNWIVLLSSAEGLPVVLCEAACYGVPGVATDVGGVREIVNENTGILGAPYPDIHELVHRMVYYEENREEYMKLRKNVFERWHRKFDARFLRRNFSENVSRGVWLW